MKDISNSAFAAVFKSYPPAIRRELLALRSLILETAAATPGVGVLDETPKWGEPAYLTSQSKIGSTIRLGWNKSNAGQYAIYFNCQTDLVQTFRTLFPKELKFAGTRAIVFDEKDRAPADALAYCICAALTYHRTGSGNRRRSFK
jgi:hypothetical protein